MSREKLKDFLRDKVGSTATSISYNVRDFADDGLDPGTDDLGRDPNTDKPLIGHGLTGKPDGAIGDSLINDFTNYLTDLQNYFPVRGGATPSQPLSRVDENGLAVELEEAGTDGKHVYVNPNVSDATGLGTTLSQYSESTYETGAGDIVKKAGKPNKDRDESVTEGAEKVSGHTLLKKIKGSDLISAGTTFRNTNSQDEDQRSIKAVQSMLQGRNRFNTEDRTGFSPFDTDGGLADKIDSGTDEIGTRTVQLGFGKYDRNPGGDSGIVINDDMKKVARSMILSSLGLGGVGGISTSDPDDFDPLTDLSKLVPKDVGSQQSTTKSPRAESAFGSPIPTIRLRPYGERFPERGAFESGNPEGSKYTQKSYGQTYSPDIQAGENTVVAKSRAAAVIIAMLAFCKGLEKDLSNFMLEANVPFDSRTPKVAGESRALSIEAAAHIQMFRRFVVPVTRYPLIQCIEAGARAMFDIGVSESSEDGSGRLDTLNYQVVSDSPAFWQAIGSSMLKKFEDSNHLLKEAIESYTSEPSTGIVDIYAQLSKSGAIKVLRVLAQIGDNILYSTGGKGATSNASTDGVRPFNVDHLLDGPQTRQSKSRSRTGQTESSLAWRNQSAPGMYLLPRNVIKAVQELNTFAAGGNPVKGHTTNSLLPKSFIDPNPGFSGNNRARIPTDVARMLEDSLDAEYVPFYFHDLRTNEFIGFHAFLESLTDSYAANFTQSQGYGRVDPVYIYKDTKRNIGFSFYVAATSKEDFDEMWFKINKLTTLVYPQWAKGTKMIDGKESSFIQPFSQVISSTPLIRLRIGDVVKSNYSKFNLARMFGIGDPEFKIKLGTFKPLGLASGAINTSSQFTQDVNEAQLNIVFAGLFGSPLALLPLSGDAGATVADVIVRSLAATAATAAGGSALLNPLAAAAVMGELRNPDVSAAIQIESANGALNAIDTAAEKVSGVFSLNNLGSDVGYSKNTSFPILKPSMDAGYKIVDSEKRIRTVAPYRVNIIDKGRVRRDSYKDANSAPINQGTKDSNVGKLYYKVKFFDLDAPRIDSEMYVFHEDLMPNPDILFLTRAGLALSAIGAAAGIAQVAVNETLAKYSGIPANALQATTNDANEFMHPANNPITRAFENSGGRGLAGVIRSLGYTWIDSQIPWETEWGSRAPKIAKITVSFDPIHDLPPGLDHGGYNRAPNYNVGATMNSVAGDPMPDEGFGSKAKYTRAATKAAQSNEDI